LRKDEATMRAFGVVLLTLLLGIPGWPSIAAQQEFPATATIRGDNIWLRVDPAEDTDILRYLQRGDQVQVTGEAMSADGDAFYPVEVVATAETGWVRELAIDPRSWSPEPEVVVVDVPEPAGEAESAEDDEPRGNRNRRDRQEQELEVIEDPVVEPVAETPAAEASAGEAPPAETPLPEAPAGKTAPAATPPAA
jgi:hypothetical protein